MRRPITAPLERCVGDVDLFLAGAWGRHPLHHPTSSDSFDDLLSMADVDRLLSTPGLRLPAFRLVKDGTTVDPATYTRTGRTGSTPITGMADPGRILEQFRAGATIVLQGLQRYWPPVTLFCRGLELAIGHPTQANAYLTPPGARGLAVHRDGHDVLVLQMFGRKRWDLFEAGSDPTGDRPSLEVDMRPGDAMYMPKGTPHAARTQEVASGHLTVGILTYTWRDLVHEALRRIEQEPDLEEPLPAGFHLDPEAFRAAVEHRLGDLQRRVAKIDAGDLAASWTRSFLTSRTPLVEGGLANLLAVGSLERRSQVRRRPGSVCRVELRGGDVEAYLGDRHLRLPAFTEPAMRFVEEHEAFEVADLERFLDPDSGLVLARRLVREGLLEVVLAP